jgi:hypothetical protein
VHLRVSPSGGDRLIAKGQLFHGPALPVALSLALALPSCRSRQEPAAALSVQWEVTPEPPRVGPAKVVLTLTDSSLKAVVGARIAIEGNMTHPGMQPVLTMAEEQSPGHYSAPLTFTMAGDWFLLATVTTANGKVYQRQVDVPRVRHP